jgi:hypothetical protein
MIRNIRNGWKTTILGLLILGLAGYAMHLTYPLWEVITLLMISIALILSPDTIISFVSNFFKRNETGNTK